MSKNYNFTLAQKVKIFECAFRMKLKMQKNDEIIPCIFHEDSTPSLSVNVQKGVYNCFGCGAKGNTFTLLQLIIEGQN